MDDLDVLARDFGYRPQGKSAPMRSSDAAADRQSSTVRSPTSSQFVDDGLLFNDVFGGPPKFTTTSNAKSSSMNDFDYDSIFKASASNQNHNTNTHSNNDNSKAPVYDKPVYDDDIFEGLPGLKSKSVSASTMRFEENVFASMASPRKQKKSDGGDKFDDLLGNLGRNEKEGKNVRNSSLRGVEDLLGNFGRTEKVPEPESSGRASSLRGVEELLGNFGRNEKVPEPKSSGRSSSSQGFDDLLSGFGSGSQARASRTTPESRQPPKSTSAMDDPFVVLESASTPASSSSGVFTDPLEEISRLGKFGSTNNDASPVSGGVFDDLDPLNGFGKSIPPISPEKGGREKDPSPSRSGPSPVTERSESSSFRYSESHSQKKEHVDNFQETPISDMPSVPTETKKNVSSPPSYASASSNVKNFQADISPRSEELARTPDDIWLTVSEIPLFTPPTKAPPPSRPPPPIPRQSAREESGFFHSNARIKSDDYSPSYSSYSESPKPGHPEGKSPPASEIDELEDFVMGRTRNSVDDTANIQPGEDMDAAAAAMKEAMDRAEAKFRHAKEVREREYAKAAKSKENVQMEKDEQDMQDAREREFKENRERLAHEQQQREKEEEREQRRLERERARQAEIERDRARQAVERATREARERAAAGARDRAAAEARLRAERAAVGKAQAEARERAERAAVQRAQAEARERAATEARDRAERAAAEAREKSNAEARDREAQEKAEARRRAERVAVERAAAEARERAAAGARERAAAAARVNQQKNENDLDSFFSTRPSSAPKARASSSDPFFDSQFQNKGGADVSKKASSTSVPSSNIRKASSTTNIVDDLSSIFGAPPSSGEFQEVDGETEERRRARLERHQRTQERAAKALAEKNQRDLQAQRDQEERHRIAGTLDAEIKRWAAGKEGNLRALLSTLQYVLWPECGWQPVSLTDLITGAHVKKVYRKATLCIHPDKVQQKGATLQQKYIAEKVFDLLKEAWNKFNSEELF